MTPSLHPRRFPKIICISGIDGSGKSTACEHLAAHIAASGYKVQVKWLRFNHVLSKPLLIFCRLVGLTRYEHIDGTRMGYHNFHRSKLISWAFITLQYLDALRVFYTRIRPSIQNDHSVIILDRYIPDILIDLKIDTRIEDLQRRTIGRAFWRLLPSDSRLILIRRSREQVLSARPENRLDDNFDRRFMHYEALAREARIHTIDNDTSVQALQAAVEHCLTA